MKVPIASEAGFRRRFGGGGGPETTRVAGGPGPFGAPGRCFCGYLFHQRPLEKKRNSGSTQNDRKASHNHPKGFARSDFSLICMPLMQPFWINFDVFVKLRKRQFCDDGTTLWKVLAFPKTCFSRIS